MSSRRLLPRSWITPRASPTRAARTGVLIAALLAITAPVAGHAEDAPVTWAVYSAPPFMIADGPDAERGTFDRIRHLLDQRLYGAVSPTLRAPFPRVLASLRDGAEICFIGGIRTPEREAFAVFSLPVALFYPLRIVVRASDRARFEAHAPLSLAALLADRSLRTSVLKDRSLGEGVDGLVRAASPRVHSEFGEAFRMLLAGRLDYLIEYPDIAGYAAGVLSESGNFATLPFTEVPAPVFSHVMCPRTAWGERFVARVDAVLRTERATPAYRRMVETWTQDGDRATIRAAYDAVFGASE